MARHKPEPEAFCCAQKQYYLSVDNLVETLIIIPRVIIYKKRLRRDHIYEQKLTIKNIGNYSRALTYSVDSIQDTHIIMPPNWDNDYLNPDQVIEVGIRITPCRHSQMNQQRHIYIESQHPNIIFEIPILGKQDFKVHKRFIILKISLDKQKIVINKSGGKICGKIPYMDAVFILNPKSGPYVPTSIDFPHSVPTTKAFYEFAAYNPADLPDAMTVKSFNPNIKISMSSTKIPKNDYVRILVMLHVRTLDILHDNFKIKFNSQYAMKDISILHESVAAVPYCNVSHLRFGEVKYKRKETLNFTVCNDSPLKIDYELKFLTNASELEEDFRKGFEMISHTTADDHETETHTEATTARLTDTKSGLGFDLNAHNHFTIQKKSGSIDVNASENLSVTFQPVQLTDADFGTDEPPFAVRTKLFFTIAHELAIERKVLIVEGLVNGPEIKITPDTFTLRKFYMGEEHCEQIEVENLDEQVSAKVRYMDLHDPRVATALCKPAEGLTLKPQETKTFVISFFTRIVGKFVVKLRFKVKNSSGQSMQVRVKLFPDILEFGSIPFAVPQKRLVLLMNPLFVPVTVQCYLAEDGEETPLVLDAREGENIQPITIRDYAHEMLVEEERESDEEQPEVLFVTTDSTSISYRSFNEDNTSVSTAFEEEVFSSLNDHALGIVNRIKHKRYSEKTETQKLIIADAMNCLLETRYFRSLSSFSNYAQLDWNTIPSSPKEIYYNKEIIYLKPNNGENIAIILIPNSTGYFSRSLDIRICPILDHDDETKNQWLSADNSNFVKSEMMVSKLWLEYYCRLPEIEFDPYVSITREKIFAGESYDFYMQFNNVSNIEGFIYYDVVPKGKDGEMFFPDNIWKYYIAANSNIFVECSVIFRKLSYVKLSGLIKIVGNINGIPFHIKANVMPASINITPNSIYGRQKVLEKKCFYLYVDNETPTVTWVTWRLKSSKNMWLEPEGARLGPNNQGTYITLHTKFYDPDLYYNTIVFEMDFGESFEIPISFIVEGMPICFEPNIAAGHDCGTLNISCAEDFDLNPPKYNEAIKLQNKGKRTYCFYINKLKNGLTKCAVDALKGRLAVTPKFICLEPQSEGYIQIMADAFEATTLYNEFSLRMVDQENKLHVHTTRFVVSARFIEPDLYWSRKVVQMEYHRTHVFKEQPLFDCVHLTNSDNVECTVRLKTLGPFKIKELFEHPYKKQLDFIMHGLEQKEIIIALSKPAIRDEFCSYVEGRIVCEANCKQQRSLLLKLTIRSPELHILNPEMKLFTKNAECTTIVELKNVCCLIAQFKWRKITEEREFISEFDNARDFIRDLLLELVHNLDINESDSEADKEPNSTLRYQMMRCKMAKLQDPIDIRLIVDEMIDNLDYEHKRYLIKWNTDVYDKCDRKTSTEDFVHCALIDFVGKLKLEDSYELSEASSDDCFMERTIYFVEKTGIVKPNETMQCVLHLPAVKVGYAHKSTFVLDVMGSCPQDFSITLVNLERVIELSQDSIYLGIKPWYELFKAKVRISNVTVFPITVYIDHATHVEKQQRIAHGSVKLTSSQSFCMSKYESKLLRFEGIMGFSEEFIYEFKVTANNSDHKSLRLRGQGVMPILTVSTRLPRLEHEIDDVVCEYDLLRRIYYFDVFRAITTEEDEYVLMPMEEEEGGGRKPTIKTQHYSIESFSFSSVHSSSATSTRSANVRFFRLMQTYVLVNNNDELPNALFLEQLLETEKFLEELKQNSETCRLLRLVYMDYLKLIKCYDEKLPINLKHFTTQPLPFHLIGNVLNMNELRVGHVRKFNIDVHFFGPGKLIAAARTEVKIPGLYVEFMVDEREDQKFLYYTAETKSPDLFGKPYRNMYERIVDNEAQSRLKRSHSFDVDRRYQHTREVSSKERKQIQNYYNSLNKSVYMEQKHHHTLCKIFSNSKTNYSGTNMRIMVVIRPDAKFYEDGQILEDYLYIDLHLGPTLPILLRGLISSR